MGGTLQQKKFMNPTWEADGQLRLGLPIYSLARVNVRGDVTLQGPSSLRNVPRHMTASNQVLTKKGSSSIMQDGGYTQEKCKSEGETCNSNVKFSSLSAPVVDEAILSSFRFLVGGGGGGGSKTGIPNGIYYFQFSTAAIVNATDAGGYNATLNLPIISPNNLDIAMFLETNDAVSEIIELGTLEFILVLGSTLCHFSLHPYTKAMTKDNVVDVPPSLNPKDPHVENASKTVVLHDSTRRMRIEKSEKVTDEEFIEKVRISNDIIFALTSDSGSLLLIDRQSLKRNVAVCKDGGVIDSAILAYDVIALSSKESLIALIRKSSIEICSLTLTRHLKSSPEVVSVRKQTTFQVTEVTQSMKECKFGWKLSFGNLFVLSKKGNGSILEKYTLSSNSTNGTLSGVPRADGPSSGTEYWKNWALSSTLRLPYTATFSQLTSDGQFLLISYSNTHLSVIDTWRFTIVNTSASPLHSFGLTCMLNAYEADLFCESINSSNQLSPLVAAVTKAASVFVLSGSPDHHLRATWLPLTTRRNKFVTISLSVLMWFFSYVFPLLVCILAYILYKSYTFQS